MSSTTKAKTKNLAYAIVESFENTGGIVFATSAIAARRIGAQTYSDSDFAGVSCKRAPYADKFAETGIVPASALVDAGWHFECTHCGVRIDTDLPDRWHDEDHTGKSFADLRKAGRRYRHWTPDAIIGNEKSLVFCDAQCKTEHHAYHAEAKRRAASAIAAYKRLVLKRFPNAVFPDDQPEDTGPRWRRDHHAYATKRRGRWRVEQIRVAFAFPGMAIGYATLEYNSLSSYPRNMRKPAFQCCHGDRNAFEAWARSSSPTAHNLQAIVSGLA